MSNTHGIADFASELQASFEDLLPACVISTTFPTVPASSLTLAAFATQAYVRDLQQLVYVDQPAVAVTLPSTAGTQWLAVTRDTSTASSGWTRRAGSHYMHQVAGSRPADVDGLLVFASVTVAGAVITAVTPAPGVTRDEAWRARAGLGTMAVQDASAVAITGGTAGLNLLTVTDAIGSGVGANPTYAMATGTKPSYFGGSLQLPTLGIGTAPAASAVTLTYARAGAHGLSIRPSADTGAGAALYFVNAAETAVVGTITTTGSTTAYNTSSDVRLKDAITAIAGALDTVQRLRPVAFRWQADQSPGHGFLAHELQQVVPDAVSGEPDGVNADGSIRPQGVDHSKLVVWLVGAVQELAAQVEALTARRQALELPASGG